MKIILNFEYSNIDKNLFKKFLFEITSFEGSTVRLELPISQSFSCCVDFQEVWFILKNVALSTRILESSIIILKEYSFKNMKQNFYLKRWSENKCCWYSNFNNFKQIRKWKILMKTLLESILWQNLTGFLCSLVIFHHRKR